MLLCHAGVPSRRHTDDAEPHLAPSDAEDSAIAPHANGANEAAPDASSGIHLHSRASTDAEASLTSARAASEQAVGKILPAEGQQAITPEEQALWDSLANSRQWRVSDKLSFLP